MIGPWLLGFLAWMLVGCSGGEGTDTPVSVPDGVGDIDPVCYGRTPKLQVGGGDVAYQALGPGSEVIMVHGPQGGWHVVASASIAYLREVVDIEVEVLAEVNGDQEVVAFGAYRGALVMESTCQGTYPGMFAYLDVSGIADGELDTPPELLSNTPALISMVAWDSDGHRAEGSLEVVLMPDPIDIKAADETVGAPLGAHALR